jgi:hypothetical protein
MLFRDIVAVYSENHTKPIYTTCGQNPELVVKAGGTFGRKVTQLKKYHLSGEEIELLFLIRVFKIEESETANTYVGKKGMLYT